MSRYIVSACFLNINYSNIIKSDRAFSILPLHISVMFAIHQNIYLLKLYSRLSAECYKSVVSIPNMV